MELTGRTSSSPTSFRYDALQCPELTTEGLLSAARQGNASGESYQHLKLGLPVLTSHMLLQAHPLQENGWSHWAAKAGPAQSARRCAWAAARTA